MSGLLVVDGLEDRLPASLKGIRERQLAIRDVQHKGDSVVISGPKAEPTTALPRTMASRAAEDLSNAPITHQRKFTFSLDTANGGFKALIPRPDFRRDGGPVDERCS